MKQKLLTLLGVWLFCFLVGLKFVALDPAPHHEGSVLVPSLWAARGLVPIKDVTIQHPPFLAYTYAGFFRIFGETLLVTRYVNLAGVSLLAGLMAVLLSTFLPLGIALTLGLAYYWGSWILWDLVTRPWSTLWGVIFSLLATGLVLEWPKRRDGRFLWGAGFFLGLAAAYRLNLGVYLFLALSGGLITLRFLKSNKVKATLLDLLRLALPLVAVTAICWSYQVWRMGLAPLRTWLEFQASIAPIMRQQTENNFYNPWKDLALSSMGIWFLLIYYTIFAILFPHFVQTKGRISQILMGLLTIVIAHVLFKQLGTHPLLFAGPTILIFSLWETWRNAEGETTIERQRIWLFTFAGISLWGLMYPGGDPRYTAWSGVVLMTIVGRNLWRQLAKGPAGQIRGWAMIVALVLWLDLLGTKDHLQVMKKALSQPRDTYGQGFYRGMKAPANDVEDGTALREYVLAHTQPNDSVVIWRGGSLDYLLVERPLGAAPTVSLDNLVYLTRSGPQIEKDILAAWEKSPPALIVTDPYGRVVLGSKEYSPDWFLPEVWAGWFTGAFPQLEAFFQARYRSAWKSPHGKYEVHRRAQ